VNQPLVITEPGVYSVPTRQFQQFSHLYNRSISSGPNLTQHQPSIRKPLHTMADPGPMPPELIAFASKLFDAARQGQVEMFEQAIPRGLPVNMTNDKGDSLVQLTIYYMPLNALIIKSNPTSKFASVRWLG
jgi:hypothetical protein